MPHSDNNTVPHSLPIPIDPRRRHHTSSSDDSSTSDDSASPASPTSPLQSPITGAFPRVVAPISPSTSPILSYFLAQSPKSPSATFPFRRTTFAPPPVVDDDDFESDKAPVSAHGRRASTAWAGADRTLGQPPHSPVAGYHQQRATGVLRRLSLGGPMGRPNITIPQGMDAKQQQQTRATTPPGMGTGPTARVGSPTRKPRRANTMAPGTQRPPRAPSPMGERILKGHFDGFN